MNIAKLSALIHAAQTAGWEIFSNSDDIPRLRFIRVVETPTAHRARYGLTYHRVFFLSFTGSSIIYRDGRQPWMSASDTKISLKRANEIIQEVTEAVKSKEVHAP